MKLKIPIVIGEGYAYALVDKQAWDNADIDGRKNIFQNAEWHGVGFLEKFRFTKKYKHTLCADTWSWLVVEENTA